MDQARLLALADTIELKDTNSQEQIQEDIQPLTLLEKMQPTFLN